MNSKIINTCVLLTLTLASIYAVVRTVLFFYLDYSPVERLFGALLITGELFILLHSAGYMIGFIRIRNRTAEPPQSLNPPEDQPWVAILVAARHEPRHVLEKTFITITNILYERKRVYFLDDSSDEQYKREAEAIAKDLELTLFRREIRHGAKAGIINDCLSGLREKYIVIFDADQQPMPEFLHPLIRLMEAAPRLGFIQTPQFYTNIETNPIARASAFQQSVFYEYICEGKSAADSMFCCGTNVIFRTEALKEVGGFDDTTVTEDFATSIKFHSKGWKSLYHNHTSAFGMGPEDLGSYFKQQFRWANGTLTVFKRVLMKFLRHPFSLNSVQWWEYFLSSTYYFIGIAYFFLMLCPILYLLFNIPSFYALPEIYFLSYLPYMFFAMTLFYILLSTRNYTFRDLFMGQVLGICAFPVYIKAAIAAMLGVKTSFGITSKEGAVKLPYTKLWPQIMMLLLSWAAMVWGINRFIYEHNPAILINLFWTAYHFLLLTGIFYFNETSSSP